MSHRTLSPFANRACSAIAMFTLASWTLIAATFLAWAPARDALGLGLSAAAANVLTRTGGHEHPAGAAIELANSTAACYSYGTSEDETAFSRNVSDDDEDVILDGRASRRLRDGGARREPRFEFREDGEWYAVRDPALVEEARLARSSGARPVATIRARADQLRAELSRLQDDLSRRQSSHASRQRELSRRMSDLSERHQRVSRAVRAEIRELARRALRKEKAERPHANA
jgi:hypothetical protein